MKDFLKKPTLYIIIIIILVILLLLKSCGPGGSGLFGGKDTNDKGKDAPSVYKVNKKNRIDNLSKSDTGTLKSICTENLNAICRFGAGTFLAVGDAGRILTSFNGGLNWKANKISAGKFYGAAVLNYDTMIAVGSKGRVFRTKDHGLTWDSVSSGTTDTIRAVSFPDKIHGIAVGDNGLILKTSDAGVSWQRDTLKPITATMTRISSVCFVNANTGWMAGDGGMIRKTTNFGGAWTPESTTTTLNLKGISFNNLNRGTAVGDGGIVLTTKDGGHTWVPTVPIGSKELKSVHRVNNVLAYIVGHGIVMREDKGTIKNLDTDPSHKFNAVDPGQYITDVAVGNNGLSLSITGGACDNCGTNGNNDLMFIPPGENDTAWTVRLRVYPTYHYRQFMRFISPGFEIHNRAIHGWTQNDSPTPTINNLEAVDRNLIGNYSTITAVLPDNREIDAITLDMKESTSGYLYFSLIPISNNGNGTGTFEFYFGECSSLGATGCTLGNQEDIEFCHKITYQLFIEPQVNATAP